MVKDILRRVILRPYRKGCGPTFTLTVCDTGRRSGGAFGRCYLSYRLTMREIGADRAVELFAGDDFSPGASMTIDSDAMVSGLLGFLTLRPGDIDQEYFDDYTAAQLEFRSQHAEALNCEVYSRFGDA